MEVGVEGRQSRATLDRDCREVDVGGEIAGGSGALDQLAHDRRVAVAWIEDRGERAREPPVDQVEGRRRRQRMGEDRVLGGDPEKAERWC
jgi:hypothetical protein